VDYLFCSLLNLFLFIFWLPEVLHLIGMTPAQTVFATSLYPLGGIFAVLYLGWAIDRFGTRRSLAVHYAVGIVFIALISLVAMPYFALLVVVVLAGVTVLGSQTGLSGACGKLYPARMRTSGYGFATGVGRLGGIAAGPLGGFLLAKGLPPTYVFLSACVFAAMAAIATAFLALPGARTDSEWRRWKWQRKRLRLRPARHRYQSRPLWPVPLPTPHMGARGWPAYRARVLEVRIHPTPAESHTRTLQHQVPGSNTASRHLGSSIRQSC
jgi:MFS family permease